MNKDELRELLHQEYKTENWKKVTEFVFPNVQYLQRPQAIPFSNDEVESFKQIGNVKLNDGKNLAMFEVKVAQNVNLVSSRVKLRKLVENLIDQERNHGVLVIYEQGKEDYRFTFTAKSTEFDEKENDFVDLETDAKRFTYILGKNESCKTAANRFWELSTHKDKATIKDVENAFSVERLNKEFFNKYKEFYEDFVQYITGKRFVKEKGKWVEKKIGRAKPIHKEVFESDDKLARNFVKLLLGRLVFIQFLQKKGWMGVPATSKQWKKGDPDFLLNLYNNVKSKDEFHSKCLYPLFYKAFNTPDRPNDVFSLTGNRVPYLNGGLFENENPKTKDIDFPATYFANLLEFFGQYNFTIDENDPLDHEVGIDPEMLGHIFENLLEDNKDKGAFYTPKPIVQYMCQESLIQYLKTYLQEHQLWPTDEETANQTETNLQNFVRKKIAGELLNDYDEYLARALKDVKICDPAIGSGAFPMGLLNEIFYCMQLLHDASPDSVGAVWEMEKWAPDIVKKNIIQHSIYGVDIEKGAVDIARLRFWLSLIVDEHEPTPLPNLDFKIMQGNSLLESYEGIDLSKIASTKTMVTEVALDLFGNPVNAQASIFDTKYIDDSNITELIDNYFSTQLPDEKQRLKKEIDNIIHKHIDYNLEFEENKILISIAEIKKNLLLLKSDKNHSTVVAAKTTKAKEKLIKELNYAQEAFEELKSKRKELHDLQKSAERPYFLWNLYFKDVIDKGGFDVVIGNPPYGAVLLDKHLLKKYFSKTSTGNIDSYKYFIDKALSLIKKNGVLCYITSDSFLEKEYFIDLRELIIEKTSDVLNIKLGDDVFESASIPTAIIITKLNSEINCVVSSSDVSSIDKIIHKLKNIESSKFPINYLSDNLKRFIQKSSFFSIQNTKPLIELYDQVMGVKVYQVGKGMPRQSKYEIENDSFLSDSPKGKLWVKFIDSGIKRYYYEDNEKYIKYGKWLAEPREEKYFNAPKVIVREVVNPRVFASYFKDEAVVKNTNAVIVEKNKESSLKFLLGILNSRLFNYYIKNESAKSSNKLFPSITSTLLKKFPIPLVNSQTQSLIVKLVDEILKLKSKDHDAVIDKIDKQIDLIVYKLYKLDYSTIKLIDPEFEYTELSYSKLIAQQ
jgi:adenine-specific DNA-methyltransferase